MSNSRPSENIPSSKSIPKIIHVIWAGGEEMMDLEGVDNVLH